MTKLLEAEVAKAIDKFHRGHPRLKVRDVKISLMNIVLALQLGENKLNGE